MELYHHVLAFAQKFYNPNETALRMYFIVTDIPKPHEIVKFITTEGLYRSDCLEFFSLKCFLGLYFLCQSHMSEVLVMWGVKIEQLANQFYITL